MSEKNVPILDKRSSRRTFIKNSGLTVGGVVLGGALGSLLGKDSSMQLKKHGHSKDCFMNIALSTLQPSGYRYRRPSERIFPKDENGPGAKELLVAYYIDHQLSGAWGIDQRIIDLVLFTLVRASKVINLNKVSTDLRNRDRSNEKHS